MNPVITHKETSLKGKHLLTLADWTSEEIEQILNYAIQLKKEKQPKQLLAGKTLGMIFEKSSTRTRVSFEVGMLQLGGHALHLSSRDIQMGRGESIADTAKVLSRYLDGIMIRTFQHEIVEELAAHADIPVINGLTDDYHPCQVLADLMTILEYKKSFAGQKLAYVGDGNNMAHSLMIGSAKVGLNCTIITPENYEPKQEIVLKAKEIAQKTGAEIVVTHDLKDGICNADAVYTDVWASMGWEDEANERISAFQDYQVNQEVLALAKPDYIFMHCLPAHRGEEVTAEVIDGPNSVVFDEAENRLHVQKALMASVM
ncbi:ornithine carbamoyltransferase [Fictibacillus enclensis]|uniref:Ornithine carbamoyltransferase n=1 Tax=Fictibacillus enclensis TaxID=1017270 RepID=A0A0V8JD19_9BACL|nr:ornithine carbamoyltransferase [Fictibacillus enclensis]KSU84833.1 ornithine carbamoyltransferase [Fictibacillus enclensis]SCB86541.1 ornithine carbamoyltransferase [Fictibacillus enclensis]